MPGYDTGYLYTYAHNLSTPREFIETPFPNKSIILLGVEGCINAVGNGWGPFDKKDMYDRLFLWRVPLITLWLTALLPAFGFWPKVFTLNHLIASPISSIWSMLSKLGLAQRTVQWAEELEKSSSTHSGDQLDESGLNGGGGEPTTSLPMTTDIESQQLLRSRPQKDEPQKDDAHAEAFSSACAVIIFAYVELGLGDEAKKAMKYFLETQWNISSHHTALKNKCKDTAFLVSSDRAARVLPSLAATGTFLGLIFMGLWKTLNAVGDRYDERNPVSAGLNRAPHNIAFGVLFFWLPFVVLMTCVIGGSQTSQVVPEVLESLRIESERLWKEEKLSRSDAQHPPGESTTDAQHPPGRNATDAQHPAEGIVTNSSQFPGNNIKSVQNCTEGSAASNQHPSEGSTAAQSSTEQPTIGPAQKKEPSFPKVGNETWRPRGMPVWQLDTFKDFSKDSEHFTFAWRAVALAVLIVLIPTVCAICISSLTPPDGFGCRAATMLAFFLSWVFNAAVDWFIYSWFDPESGKGKSDEVRVFQATLCKDIIFLGGTVTTLAFGAIGVYNKCTCWSKWLPTSTRYIYFLQDDHVFQLIKGRLRKEFLIAMCAALFSQLFFVVVIWFSFRKAFHVLEQRDLREKSDGRSTWDKVKRFVLCDPRDTEASHPANL